MRTKEELKEIYEGLNESEKHGVQFGLFPAKLLEYNLNNEEIANLMRVRMETEKYDVNNV